MMHVSIVAVGERGVTHFKHADGQRDAHAGSL